MTDSLKFEKYIGIITRAYIDDDYKPGCYQDVKKFFHDAPQTTTWFFPEGTKYALTTFTHLEEESEWIEGKSIFKRKWHTLFLVKHEYLTCGHKRVTKTTKYKAEQVTFEGCQPIVYLMEEIVNE